MRKTKSSEVKQNLESPEGKENLESPEVKENLESPEMCSGNTYFTKDANHKYHCIGQGDWKNGFTPWWPWALGNGESYIFEKVVRFYFLIFSFLGPISNSIIYHEFWFQVIISLILFRFLFKFLGFVNEQIHEKNEWNTLV